MPAEASLRNPANHDCVLDYWAKGFMARVNAFFSCADGPPLEARCISLAYNHDDDQTQWVFWDNPDMNELVGRVVLLDDRQRIIFTPKSQRTSRSLAPLLRAERLNILIPNARGVMLRASAALRGAMDHNAVLINQLYEFILDTDVGRQVRTWDPRSVCVVCNSHTLADMESIDMEPLFCPCCALRFHGPCMQQFVPIHHGDLAAAAGLPPEDVQRRLDACVVLQKPRRSKVRLVPKRL